MAKEIFYQNLETQLYLKKAKYPCRQFSFNGQIFDFEKKKHVEVILIAFLDDFLRHRKIKASE